MWREKLHYFVQYVVLELLYPGVYYIINFVLDPELGRYLNCFIFRSQPGVGGDGMSWHFKFGNKMNDNINVVQIMVQMKKGYKLSHS